MEAQFEAIYHLKLESSITRPAPVIKVTWMAKSLDIPANLHAQLRVGVDNI